MPEFMLAYHGGNMPKTPDQSTKVMVAWETWYDDLGTRVVHPGNPLGMSKTVTATGVKDNGGANPLSGFTIIKVETIEEACKFAATCPMVVNGGGTAEVAEIIEM